MPGSRRTAKKYAKLVKSSALSKEDLEPEQILLELSLMLGSKTMTSCKLGKIFKLIHENYHSLEDSARSWSNITWHMGLTIVDVPPLAFASDVMLKNIFKILFETSAWDDIILSGKLEATVSELAESASANIQRSSADPSENAWRKFTNHIAIELMEIWNELLEKLATKKRELETKEKDRDDL